ncbi:MAG: M1 family aminopeptidase [Nitrosomonas sp.]|nr:M1 family aminopeptidase [Nitrosomonas sp.]MDP1949485.1 M1 family aminopeptidase [Nitrosomonas sp.]
MTGWHLFRCLFAMVIAFCVVTSAAAINRAGDIDYDINVRIDPAAHSMEGRSVITVKNATELRLILGRRFEVTQALIEGKPLEPSSDTSPHYHSWHIPFSLSTSYRIEIHWRGELSPLDTALDHQQTLGRPVAVSSDEGTYLPNSSSWYPSIVGALVHYRVNLELPSGQRGLVAGRLIKETESTQGYQASFEFPFPAEGIDLMAGPYRIETDTMQGANGKQIQLRTYFHPEISQLAPGYLDSVKGYVELYESWIGDYPFTEFSVVSSPTPTGFGMPTLTYLGVDVLRLPFIRATSLGHEVLHNWWGNGVYPDYRKGNWSEGLTTFMADYAYTERESSAAAREMRLGWLRDFAALAPDQDAPLSSFTSRTHAATKIVGYNKAAMLFFMLRDQLGEEMFDRAIQAFWTMRRFKITSWQDIQRIFEMVSTQDLNSVFNQWLDRAGAPAIRIVEASQRQTQAGHQIALTLEQATPVYQLQVPIVIRSAAGEETRHLALQHEQQTFTLDLKHQPLEVVLDPDLRLFRQLAPGEAPPILREVMVNQATATILLPEQGEIYHLAETLASKLQHRTPEIIPAANQLPAIPILVIGLRQQIDAWLIEHNLPARPDIVADKGSAQAWTLTRVDGITLAVVSAQDAASLAALIRPLPHYGRQSYIVFEGAKVIDRGAWPMQVQTVTVKR